MNIKILKKLGDNAVNKAVNNAFFIALSILVSVALSGNAMASESIDQILEVKKGGDVEISIVSGELTVRGWDKPSVRVKGDIDTSLEDFTFETHGDTTRIEVEHKNGGFFGEKWGDGHSTLEVFIPTANVLDVDGVSLDVDVDGLRSEIRVGVVSGDIDVSNVIGDIDLHSVSGDISVQESQGKIKLATVSGNIETDGKAKHFDAESVSGDIDARIGFADMIELASVSGDLNIDFDLAHDGEVEADTVSGNITLKFGDSKLNARFELNTGPGGNIITSLSDKKIERTFIGSEELEFKLGDGNGEVEITTMSGTIKIE